MMCRKKKLGRGRSPPSLPSELPFISEACKTLVLTAWMVQIELQKHPCLEVVLLLAGICRCEPKFPSEDGLCISQSFAPIFSCAKGDLLKWIFVAQILSQLRGVKSSAL